MLKNKLFIRIGVRVFALVSNGKNLDGLCVKTKEEITLKSVLADESNLIEDGRMQSCESSDSERLYLKTFDEGNTLDGLKLVYELKDEKWREIVMNGSDIIWIRESQLEFINGTKYVLIDEQPAEVTWLDNQKAFVMRSKRLFTVSNKFVERCYKSLD